MPHQTPLPRNTVINPGNMSDCAVSRRNAMRPLKDNNFTVVPRSPGLQPQSLKSDIIAVGEKQIPHNSSRSLKALFPPLPQNKGKILQKRDHHDNSHLRHSEDEIFHSNLSQPMSNSTTSEYRNKTTQMRPKKPEVIEDVVTTPRFLENENIMDLKSLALKQPSQDRAEKEILKILETHASLEAMTCLKPHPEINGLFGDLVGTCVQILPAVVIKKIISDQRILTVLPSLRSIASIGESHLESHWATLIVASCSSTISQLPLQNAYESSHSSPASSPPSSPSPLLSQNSSSTSLCSQADLQVAEDRTFELLQSFPYYQNYIDLARMELSTLLPLFPPERKVNKIAFIGSGPLPLTSLCISRLLAFDQQLSQSKHVNEDPCSLQAAKLSTPESSANALEVLNIDSSASAIAQSSALCSLLGRHARGMVFAHELAGSPSRDLTPYDVVFLAALVGSDQEEKEEVLLNVVSTMRAGALVVIRSSHGLRRVLYPEFEFATESVLRALDVEVVVHPCSHVVNSVIVARVR